MVKLISIFMVIAFALAFFIGGCILSGYTISMLWAWFIVPLGAKALPLAHAIGLSVLVNFMTSRYKTDPDPMNKDDSYKSQFERLKKCAKLLFNYMVMRPLVCLFIGYIVHTYFMS